MGSSSSKAAAASDSSESGVPKSRSRCSRSNFSSSRARSRILNSSSCLGFRSYESDHHLFLEERGDGSISNHSKLIGDLNNYDDDQTTNLPTTIEEEEEDNTQSDPHHSTLCCGHGDANDDDKVNNPCSSEQQNHNDNYNGDLSSSQSTSASSRSRFSFIPPNFSFKLTRASSFGSSPRLPFSFFSKNTLTTTTTTTTPCANAPHSLSSNPLIVRNQGSHLLPPCASDVAAGSHLPARQYASSVLGAHPNSSHCLSLHPQDNDFISYQDNDNDHDDIPIYNVNTGILPDIHHHTSSNENSEIDFIQSRHPSNRHIGAREPAERSIRFSRALSVGRLRDRVIRRSSFTDGLFGRVQQDRQVGGFPSQENRTDHALGGIIGTPTFSGNANVSPLPSPHPLSTMSNSMHNNQDDQLETSRPREARYHDLMEHRTDFLERRRRIRSQVRALQRLGSRFENLSGHERSCILAGQHRSGLCTCRTSNRARNPDDNTSARASISRIVMLAEALFEVLDEIHQQSVVLSSRPSVSSLGSIPAPKEVVESMPVKIYTKLQKHQLEDVPQCYICLVEYEEGDSMRILPCHHEFHRPCIDKWLKEIHRVCPLCRGDVCATP